MSHKYQHHSDEVAVAHDGGIGRRSRVHFVNGMRRAAAVIGLGFATASAFGAAGEITASVTQVGATRVTYSTSALTTNVAFQVALGNVSGNTINNIVYTVKASATDSAESVALDLAKGPLPSGCTASTTTAGAFTCTVAQLKAGVAIAPYVVFWRAPMKVDGNAVADNQGEDFISTSISVVYAEQFDGATNNNNSFFTNTYANQVELGTSSTTDVRSTVSKLTGASLFTGEGAVATAADPWTTTVIVPPGYVPADAGATYTSAVILEAQGGSTLSSDLLTSNETALTIPGSSAAGTFLTIILRRDSSTIVRSAKISNAQIYYSGDHVPAPIAYPYSVLPCSDTSLGLLPQRGIPCIQSRKVYTKKDAQSLGAEWDGDWEFVLKAVDNGKYIN